jgi:hypothetical protein
MDQMSHVTIWLVTKNSNGHHGSCTQLVACATFMEYMDGWNMNPYRIYGLHTYCHMQLWGLTVACVACNWKSIAYDNWKWQDSY